MLELPAAPPAMRSYSVAGARRTRETTTCIEELYPPAYGGQKSVLDHLQSVLRHEPLDFAIVSPALKAIGAREIEAWAKREPTGSLSRRARSQFPELTDEELGQIEAGVCDAMDGGAKL